MEEIWRLVPSVPTIMASSLGRIMVIPYVAVMPHGGKRQYGGEPTFGQWDEERYVYVVAKKKTHKVARLICEAFNGPAPNDKSVCMHLDENSRNNRPWNLQWGTQKENLNAVGFLEYCRGRTGENNPRVKGGTS